MRVKTTETYIQKYIFPMGKNQGRVEKTKQNTASNNANFIRECQIETEDEMLLEHTQLSTQPWQPSVGFVLF